MNFSTPEIASSVSFSKRLERAFTFTETMVAMALFGLTVMAIIGCHLAGLEFNEFVRPKVENSKYARQTLSRIIEEVRCANSIQVGTGTLSSFSAVGATNAQSGNALRIYPTTNLTQFIYYFHDTASNTVVKIPLLSSNGITIATSVTNDYVFTMENFSGVALSNSQNNAVLSFVLQMRRPSSKAGMSDSYQVRSRITRRNIL